jgi:putative PIG3 family NAD(P)H quinone oxidoreductase
MRFVAHGDGGPSSALHLAETDVPVAGPGEVLIRVAYAGINRPDIGQRRGTYPPPAGASPIIGLEVAGEVVRLGEGVSGFALGDAVCALTNGGGYAEYVAVASGQVLPVPAGLSLLEAASLPENYFTVWTNVFDRGRLAEGEKFLVHGGSSGIGLTAIQLAHARGAKVYTTVGSAEKAQACIAHGADAAINYREEDFVARVLELTGKRGVDVILDMVGGEYIGRNISLLADQGRLVQIAYIQGTTAQIDAGPIARKRLTFTGSNLRPRTVAEKAAIAGSLRKEVWPLLEARKVRPVIHAVFDLADASKAHDLMESSKHIGKIMLKVRAAA